MVASTDIKFYVHTNTNAPQLQNAYGCMIDVLDACLINGFGSQSVATLTASGTRVTATFGSAHNYLQYQVIKIAGATQTEFNGEHRILTVPNANTITFELNAVPSVTTATGTITSSLPSLGWLKPFSGTGKAAYRSSNTLLASRPYLRVIDALDPAYTSTYAKYAKVGIVEDMTDIDTMLGVQAPFDAASPDKNWIGTGSGTAAINGWAKWYYARGSAISTSSSLDGNTAANGMRNYTIIGNDEFFYVLNGHTSADLNNLIYGFGALHSNDKAFYLSATLSYQTASTNNTPSYNSPLSSGAVSMVCTIRSFTGTALSGNTGKCVGIAPNQGAFFSGGGNTYDSSNIVYSDVYCVDSSNVMRGAYQSLKWIYQVKPHINKQPFQTIDGKLLLPMDCFSFNQPGQVVFVLGDV